jgi:hypothetical protein
VNLSAALSEEDNETQVAEILPAIATTLSLMSVKPQFSQYVAATEKMALDAAAININNEDGLKFAVALGGEAKKIVKAIESRKKDVTADASEYVKSVNGFCKMFTDKLGLIETTLKQKITAYQIKVELERRKQEEAARKAAAELQAKLDAEAAEANRKAKEEAARKAEEEARAKKASEAEIAAAKKAAEDEAAKHEITAPQLPDMVIPKQETVTRTETGTSSYQVKTWKCYVQSPDLVPREYCVPDGRLLNQAVKQGIREIPGCSIVEENSTRFRT